MKYMNQNFNYMNLCRCHFHLFTQYSGGNDWFEVLDSDIHDGIAANRRNVTMQSQL